MAGIPELDGLTEQHLDVNEVPQQQPDTLPITTDSAKAREYFWQARHRQWNFDIDGAIRYYQKALKHDPEFVRAHLQLGLLKAPKSNWHLIRAGANLDLLPESERKFASLILKNRLHTEPLQKLADQYPNDAEVLLYLGLAYKRNNQLPAARDSFLAAIKKYPVSALAWQNLAEQYLALKDHYRAYIALEKEKSLIPDRAQAYLALGGFYLKTWKYGKAMHIAEKAIRIDPGRSQGYVLMAHALTLSGDSESAQEVLLAKLNLVPESPDKIEYEIALVDTLIDDDNYPEAIKILSRLYRETSLVQREMPLVDRGVRGGDIYFLTRLGDTYLEYGDYGSAQDVYDNVLRICEESADNEYLQTNLQNTYLFNTARVALVKDNVGKARRLKTALSQGIANGNNSDLARKIAQLEGEIQLAAGNPDRAIDFFRQADTDNPYLLHLLATAYMQAGQTASARKYYKKAIEYSSFDRYEYAFVRHKARAALHQSEPLVVDRE